jgi:1-acyl-sn-glycerol-3-phosphate acyltransferase
LNQDQSIIGKPMKKWIACARMIFICTVIALYLVVVGIPVLTYCRIVSNPRLALRLTRFLDKMVLFLAGVRIETSGYENLEPGKGYVFVGNHRSYADVPAVFAVLPGDLRFLAKKELYKIPLVSFALKTMGMIPVDRSNHEAAAQSVDRAVAHLQAGRSVILFPEGTRNRNETGMLPFKKGAFVLALKAGVPIVPITLLGAEKAIKPDTIFLYPATIRIIIGVPIETSGMTLEDRDTLLAQSRSVIEKTYLQNSRSV